MKSFALIGLARCSLSVLTYRLLKCSYKSAGYRTCGEWNYDIFELSHSSRDAITTLMEPNVVYSGAH